MDLAFLKQGLAWEGEAGADFGVLVATLALWQLASEAARAETLAKGASVRPPLVDIVTGSDAWRHATLAQGGCFNARQARPPNGRQPK